jgi:hypothetical protein
MLNEKYIFQQILEIKSNPELCFFLSNSLMILISTWTSSASGLLGFVQEVGLKLI